MRQYKDAAWRAALLKEAAMYLEGFRKEASVLDKTLDAQAVGFEVVDSEEALAPVSDRVRDMVKKMLASALNDAVATVDLFKGTPSEGLLSVEGVFTDRVLSMLGRHAYVPSTVREINLQAAQIVEQMPEQFRA